MAAALDARLSTVKTEVGSIDQYKSAGTSPKGRTAAQVRAKPRSPFPEDSALRGAHYLVLNHQIPAYRIYVIEMGNASVAKGASGTRVEIRLLKNDLEQTAKQ